MRVAPTRGVFTKLSAICLANIFSLLFTYELYQFTSSKKTNQNQHCLNMSSFELYFSESDKYTTLSGFSDCVLISHVTHLYQTKIYKKAKDLIKNVNEGRIIKFSYNCTLPPFWNPSIPIADRKLVI